MKREEAIVKLKNLVGVNLHDLVDLHEVTYERNGKTNKGWAGHVLERYLGLPINSAQSPNFGSWELKSIPLKYLKNGKLAFKETMAITMIDPVNVRLKEFEDSHLLSKLRKAVIVARIVGNNVNEATSIYSVTEFDLSEELYQKVKEDYNLVRNILLNDPENGFNTLTGKMGYYIQPRTKGKGHGSKTRAFYARKRFLAEFIKL